MPMSLSTSQDGNMPMGRSKSHGPAVIMFQPKERAFQPVC